MENKECLQCGKRLAPDAKPYCSGLCETMHREHMRLKRELKGSRKWVNPARYQQLKQEIAALEPKQKGTK